MQTRERVRWKLFGFTTVLHGGSVVSTVTTTTASGSPWIQIHVQDASSNSSPPLTWFDSLDWKDVLVFCNPADVGLNEFDDKELGYPL
jgi:hypothetical protein